MSKIPIDKFEKADLVIKLHKEGRTYRDIAHIAHVSVRDIKPILKKYERKLETKKEVNNQKINKLSLSSQAFLLYQEGKKLSEVKVLLDIPFKTAMIYWEQFLKSIRMEDCYEFYQDHSYDIPTFLSINTFMERNNTYGEDIANVLRTASDVVNLNQIHSNLKTEIEKLKQSKNKYSLNQNANSQPKLLPLGLPQDYYRYYYGY